MCRDAVGVTRPESAIVARTSTPWWPREDPRYGRQFRAPDVPALMSTS